MPERLNTKGTVTNASGPPVAPAENREPTFEDAQSWWRRMRRPVTFTGVPGHPFQTAVLWNGSLLFFPLPHNFEAQGLKLGWLEAWGLHRELEGYETDALQVEFSLGETFHYPDRMDNTAGECAQELLDGHMPVVLGHVEHEGLRWICTVFSRVGGRKVARTGKEILLTEVRWTAHNPSPSARGAQLACHLNAPHCSLGYKVKLEEKAFPYMRRLRWQSPLLADDRRKARLAAEVEGEGEVAFYDALPEDQFQHAESPIAEWGLTRDVLLFRAQVPPGESVSLRLLIPFFAVEPDALGKALEADFDASLARARSYWKREFAAGGQITTPEKIVNDCFDAYLYQAMLATGRRPRCGHWVIKLGPNYYEPLWTGHSAIAAFSMDLRGKHAWSRKVFDTFLATQGPAPASILNLLGSEPVGESEGFSPHPGFLGNIEGQMAILWVFYHGWIMWAIGQHARLSDEWQWIERHAEELVLACEWVAEQRKRTQLLDEKGEKVLSYGLLPAAGAFDWGFGHMFWSDAHTYRGLKEVAECLQHIGHPRAEEFLSEVESYRNDIVASVTRCRDAAPRVPLEDGTTMPYVPMSVEMRDYFEPDWTYVACGPLNLAWAGVVPADHELISQTLAFLEAGKPLGEWVEAKKKYQGWDRGANVPSDEDFLEATRPARGRAYLWQHKMTYEPGWVPQAFAFMGQDDIPAFLEHFYSLISNGGQHVEVRSPVEQRDGVAWTQPGNANLLWLMRNMLVREREGELILAGTCPRAWLEDGKVVEVKNLLTYFGRVGFRAESQTKRGKIVMAFTFNFRKEPKGIRVRLRHPEGAVPKEVMVDGKPWDRVEGEWVFLPPTCRQLEARY